jgi:hypothetical protein
VKEKKRRMGADENRNRRHRDGQRANFSTEKGKRVLLKQLKKYVSNCITSVLEKELYM